jgi:uncharacterized protein YlxW (UPF0749 family)
MGQQRNAKLIRRKIRQELVPLYQAVGSMAQALHQHLQEAQKVKDIQGVSGPGSTVIIHDTGTKPSSPKEDGGKESLPTTAT